MHAYPDGRAPGRERLERLGLAHTVVPAPGTSQDVAMLLAYEKGAALIVSVGAHFNLIEFLDKDRAGMSSTFLTRLRIGETLVDAKGVSRLYAPGVSGRQLALLRRRRPSSLIAIVVASSPALDNLFELLWLKIKVLLALGYTLALPRRRRWRRSSSRWPIGILIGVGFGDDVISGTAENLEESLKGDLEDARDRTDELQAELDRERDFAEGRYPASSRAASGRAGRGPSRSGRRTSCRPTSRRRSADGRGPGRGGRPASARRRRARRRAAADRGRRLKRDPQQAEPLGRGAGRQLLAGAARFEHAGARWY